MAKDSFLELPDAKLSVRRVDGTIEHDLETTRADQYALLTEQVRGLIGRLASLDKGQLHSRHVLALFTTAPAAGQGEIEMTPTVLTPTDPELCGAMAFGSILAMRKHAPAGYEVMIRRMRDAGMLPAGPGLIKVP